MNDTLKQSKLVEMNYRVITVWECEIKNKTIYTNLVKNVKN